MSAALERSVALLEPGARGAPVGGAYLDLLAGTAAPASTGRTQDLMLGRAVPVVYERLWRPAWGRVATGVFGPSMAEEHRIARLLLGLAPGDGVLDVACGPGNFTRDFGRVVGPEGLAVGIDASVTMLRRAARDTDPGRHPSVAFVRGDAVRLPFRAQSFDAVCCFLALHLFADPLMALDEMVRVLTPGGRLALFTTCRLRSAPLGALSEAVGAQAGMHMFGRDDVGRALLARGLVDLRVRPTGLTQYVGARKPA